MDLPLYAEIGQSGRLEHSAMNAFKYVWKHNLKKLKRLQGSDLKQQKN